MVSSTYCGFFNHNFFCFPNLKSLNTLCLKKKQFLIALYSNFPGYYYSFQDTSFLFNLIFSREDTCFMFFFLLILC